MAAHEARNETVGPGQSEIDLASRIDENYSLQQLGELGAFLTNAGTFDVDVLPSGLFSASDPGKGGEFTGMQDAWVRDTVYCAEALWRCGSDKLWPTVGRPDKLEVARDAMAALMRHFHGQQSRFEAVIDGSTDISDRYARPHVRLNAVTGGELEKEWSHAQNDALGNFLRVYCDMAYCGQIEPSDQDLETLALFPKFFEKIEYWQDEDSGHWEEVPKVEASSIGPAVAGLQALGRLMNAERWGCISTPSGTVITSSEIMELAEKGKRQLDLILPWESKQPGLEREADSALLFLSLLGVADDVTVDQILANTRRHLEGEHGTKRYPMDSYWRLGYRLQLEDDKLMADYSDPSDSNKRGEGQQPGEEAEWCMFDPITSVIYGERYQRTGDSRYLELQTQYFNRALGHLRQMSQAPDKLKMPEMFVQETDTTGNVEYVLNTNGPLLWGAMNLMRAYYSMVASTAMKTAKCLSETAIGEI